MSIPTLSQDGKVAVVTGARRGLGKAMALAFAEAGADVAVSDVVADDGELEATAEAIRGHGRRALATRTDVTDKTQVEAMAGQVMDEFGRIDVLINNAGVAGGGTLLQFDEEEFDRVYGATVKGTLQCTKAVGEVMMRQRSGCIINLSSMGAYLNKGTNAYGMAKISIVAVTKSLAWDLGRFGVRVNAIAPGVIDTDMTKPMLVHPEIVEFYEKATPLGRIGQPDDIAHVALFLASDAARFMTGQTLLTDGGITPLDLHRMPVPTAWKRS